MTISLACGRCGKLSTFSNDNPEYDGQWRQECGHCGWWCVGKVTGNDKVIREIDQVFEKLGQISDTADNLTCAVLLPMPPQFHVTQLCAGLEGIRDALRQIYVEVSGENPWEET